MFAKFFSCISRPLPNQTKLSFDQDSKLVEVVTSEGELNVENTNVWVKLGHQFTVQQFTTGSKSFCFSQILVRFFDGETQSRSHSIFGSEVPLAMFIFCFQGKQLKN